MKPLGLFDMDGTLCDYHGRLVEDLRKLASPLEPVPDDPLDDSEPWMKARQDLIKSKPGWWLGLQPLRLGCNVLYAAQRYGFDIEILTKGPRNKRRAWMEKAEWIDTWFQDVAAINIVGKDKQHYYGRFLCDDYPVYLEGWLKHRPRGLGILIDNPRNRGWTHPSVIRYDGSNMDEVERHLAACYRRRGGEHWRDYLVPISETSSAGDACATSPGLGGGSGTGAGERWPLPF